MYNERKRTKREDDEREKDQKLKEESSEKFYSYLIEGIEK